MPYIPRAPRLISCAHCNVEFYASHLKRRYCSNSCNVLASYARNGRTKLERAQKEIKLLVARSKMASISAEATRKSRAKKPAGQ